MERLRSRYFGLVLPLTAVLVAFTGCNSSQKMAPHLGYGGFNIEAKFERDDVAVLDSVEGNSTRRQYFFGIVEVIDGDKLQVMGIKFFKDKFTWTPGTLLAGRVASRAYYKALEAHPDADAVFSKAWDKEESGIPLIWHTVKVTFKGKAIRIKADR